MHYKIVFFDRDNRLTYSNPEKVRWRNEIIESWSGKRFEIDYNRMMNLFHSAKYATNRFKNVEQGKLGLIKK